MTLLTEEVRAAVGRTVTYTAPEPLGRAAIRYFAVAIGDDNPVYVNDDAARAAGYDGVIAPPTLVCETNQYMPGPRDADGYLGHAWGFQVPGARLLRGGNSYEFGRPVRPDDVVTATWKVLDAAEHTSRSGRPLLVVTSQATYTDAAGELLATNTETLIFQPTGEPA